MDIAANAKPKAKRDVELTFDELETVSGGLHVDPPCGRLLGSMVAVVAAGIGAVIKSFT